MVFLYFSYFVGSMFCVVIKIDHTCIGVYLPCSSITSNTGQQLLPGVRGNRATGQVNPYARVINFYNHAKHAAHEVAEVEEDHKRVFKFLVKEIDNIYKGMRTPQGTQA